MFQHACRQNIKEFLNWKKNPTEKEKKLFKKTLDRGN
jgi:hypothetical protein